MSIWDQAPKNTQAVYYYLVELAECMCTASYGEIAKEVSKRVGHEVAPISLNYPLGFIRDHICRERGLPWLNALAVNGETWRPGDSFLPPGVAMGQDEDVLWRGAVLSVLAYPWKTVRIE